MATTIPAPGARNLPTIPDQRGVVAEVLDRGIQDGFNPGQKVHKYVLVYQLEERGEERRKEVWDWITLSGDPRSTMVKRFKKILGRDPVPGESTLEELLGRPVFVQLEIEPAKVKVDTVTAYRGPDPLELEDYTPYEQRVREREQREAQPAAADPDGDGYNPDDDIPF